MTIQQGTHIHSVYLPLDNNWVSCRIEVGKGGGEGGGLLIAGDVRIMSSSLHTVPLNLLVIPATSIIVMISKDI